MKKLESKERAGKNPHPRLGLSMRERGKGALFEMRVAWLGERDSRELMTAIREESARYPSTTRCPSSVPRKARCLKQKEIAIEESRQKATQEGEKKD